MEGYFRLIAYYSVVIFYPFSLKQWFAFNLYRLKILLSRIRRSAVASLHSLPKLDDDMK